MKVARRFNAGSKAALARRRVAKLDSAVIQAWLRGLDYERSKGVRYGPRSGPMMVARPFKAGLGDMCFCRASRSDAMRRSSVATRHIYAVGCDQAMNGLATINGRYATASVTLLRPRHESGLLTAAVRCGLIGALIGRAGAL